jgi:putative ABC transport system ATP-binding protein
MLVFSHVSKIYRQGTREVRALDRVDLSIGKGEFVVVNGPSGCGKSTLLHLLAGLDVPDEGKILVEGLDISEMTDDEVTVFRRQHIGIVFQFFHLLPSLTAVENVALPLQLSGERCQVAQSKARDLLLELGMGCRLDHRPGELSGGEMQRVALARAFVTSPVLLLADEPTGNLDTVAGGEILELLRELHRKRSTTVVLVTHDYRAAGLGQKVLRMQDGKIVNHLNVRYGG